MMRSPSAARRAMWLVVRCIGPKACPSEPIRERTRASKYSPVIGVPSTDTPGRPNLHSNWPTVADQ
jgi:hypothetical protein